MGDYPDLIYTKKKIFVLVLVSFFFILISFGGLMNSAAFPQDDDADDDSSGDGMPDIFGTMEIEYNWISITQDSEHELTVDERIGFTNTGTENYTKKIYFWSQPVLESIVQFGPVINETYTLITPKPTSTGTSLFINLTENNLTIEPNETLEFVFKYTLHYSESWEYLNFTKTFLYDTSNLIVIVKPYQDFIVEGVGGGLQLNEDPSTGTYSNPHGGASSYEMSELISIKLSRSIPDDDDTDDDGEDSSTFFSRNIGFILLAIAVVLIIAIFIIYRIKAGGASKDDEDTASDERVSRQGKKSSKPSSKEGKKQGFVGVTRKGAGDKKKGGSKSPTSEKGYNELNKDKKKILKATARLKKDYHEGIISKDVYDDLRLKYKMEKKAIDKRIEMIKKENKAASLIGEKKSKKILELEEKKETVLNAIKKLEDDLKAGTIDDELYKDMRNAYKKKAIDLLKKIDNEKEKV